MKTIFILIVALCHVVSLYTGWFFLTPILAKAGLGQAAGWLAFVPLVLMELAFALFTARALGHLLTAQWANPKTWTHTAGMVLFGLLSTLASVLGVVKTPYFRAIAPQVDLPTAPAMLATDSIRASYAARLRALDKDFMAISIEAIQEKQSLKAALIRQEARDLAQIDSTNRAREQAWRTEVRQRTQKAQSHDQTDRQQAMVIVGFVLGLALFLQLVMALEHPKPKEKKVLKNSPVWEERPEMPAIPNQQKLSVLAQKYGILDVESTIEQILCQNPELEARKPLLRALLTSEQSTTVLQKEWEAAGTSKTKFYDVRRQVETYLQSGAAPKLRVAK